MDKKKIRLFTAPNFVTLANLACGSAAAVFALYLDDLRTAFWLVAAAAVLDFLDGFVARLTKQYSEVGKQLDSLCDMVSFGFAPAAVLFSMYNMAGGTGLWGWCAFLVALFSALRLAKFNVDESQSDTFTGLPTPASALLVVSAGWLYASGSFPVDPRMIPLAAALISYLLVCPLRMFSLKFHDYAVRNNAVRYGFILLAAAGLAAFGIAAIPFIITGYVLTSLIRSFACPKR